MTKNEFNLLSDKEQWEWVLSNKDKKFKIELDNDSTYLMVDSEDWYSVFKADLGNREGVMILLTCLGIEVSYV